jgi:hypothetical protein
MKFTENKNSKYNQLDRLVCEQNIVRYRCLLDPKLDVRRRRAILGLLKREFDKLRERPTVPTKSTIALSVLPILTWACLAPAAWANESVNGLISNNSPQVEDCRAQDVGSLSGSDFVAVPYTFGNELNYRRAWNSGKEKRKDYSERATKD